MRANRFLTNNARVHIYQLHRSTIRYLLRNGHCGINNRVRMDDIIQYLNQRHNLILGRENFQQTVLGELKRAGIIATMVYPGPRGGVFIPTDINDVRVVVRQLLDRVISEIRNMEGSTYQTPIRALLYGLRVIVRNIQGQI